MLVRVKACGVCHTDMYTASGVDPSGYAPTVLGHEGAGVVEAVGEGVTSLAPGDHVLTLFSPQCRECIHCTSGKTNICLAIREQQNLGHLPDGTTRLHRGDERIRHFMGTSTFAEATVMPEVALAKVPSEAPLDVLCTLACGATTGIGAAIYIAKVERGSTCAIFGAGLVGLGAVAGCVLAGAERIVIVDPSAERRAQARAIGATDELEGGDGAVEQILEMTGGFGADYTFEATGLVAVMRQAVEAARMGWGQCVDRGRRRPRRDARHRPALPDHRPARRGRLVRRRARARQRPGAGAALPRRQAAARSLHLAPPAARARQRRVRADARAGRHPHRADVRLSARVRSDRVAGR